MTILRRKTDKQWLEEGHLRGHVVPTFDVAQLLGTEEYPRIIVLYPRQDFTAVPVVYDRQADGSFVRRPDSGPDSSSER